MEVEEGRRLGDASELEEKVLVGVRGQGSDAWLAPLNREAEWGACRDAEAGDSKTLAAACCGSARWGGLCMPNEKESARGRCPSC